MSRYNTSSTYSKVFSVFDKYITRYQSRLEEHTRNRDIALAYILDCSDILTISDYYLADVLEIDDILEEKTISEYRLAASVTWHSRVKSSKYQFVKTADGRSDLLHTYILSYAYHTKIIEYCAHELSKYRGYIFNLSMVNFFVSAINKQIARFIIDGNPFKLSSGIGVLQIMQNDPRRPKTKMIRWDKSIELKRQLLDNNIPLYSLDNPDGIKWIVKDYADLRVWWVWKRGYNKFHRNQKRFLFRPTAFNISGMNVEEWVNSDVSDDKLLSDLRLGNAYKTIIMDKRHPYWHLKFPELIFTANAKQNANCRGV